MSNKNSRRSAALQIYLPLLIVIGLISAGVTLILSGGQSDLNGVRNFGDIAATYLLFLLMAPFLIGIAALIFLITIHAKAAHALATVFPKINHQVERINNSVISVITTITKPIIELDARLFILTNIFSKKDSDGE